MKISRIEDNKVLHVNKVESLFRSMEAEMAVGVLAKEYKEQRKTLAEIVNQANIFDRKNKRIETIGIYYHRMTPGGVQRVISLLIPIYIEAGYRVILFTDEKEEGEYEVPSSVIRVVLPSALVLPYDKYEERAILFRKMVEEYKVDIMLYHAAESRFLLYDMILVKALGIPFCIEIHGLFSAEMLRLNHHITEKKETFRLADRLIVLSQTEKYFWQSLGIKAVYIPNPIQELPFIEQDGKYILWLGRLEETQKQPSHGVDIMRRVIEICPEAKMKIVGQEVTKGIIKRLNKKIRRLGLEKNIELCGGTENVQLYYREAHIFLCTSAYEAFPMTIVESKGYGIPLVTYAMPYLEVLKSHRGCICVPGDDVEGAATAVVQLLKDEDLHRRLKEQARKSYEELRAFDLKGTWEDFLTGFMGEKAEPGEGIVNREESGLLLTTLLEHYDKGCRRNGEEAEYAFCRGLWKLGRLYRFWKENGFGKTKDIIVRKIGDTHDKN